MKEPIRFPIISVFAFCAAFALACLASCQSAGKAVYSGLGKPSDPVPFMAKARTGTLPSGLRYYILENSKPEGRAFLTLAVDAGSVLETEDERGLAHFVEHMAFNGTTRFPELELISYLRSLGMRFGPEVNAYTSYDETVYGIETTVEADANGRNAIPDRALAIIDDWTHAITFAPKDVDDERLIIMEEYRSRLGASERIRRQMLPVLFKGSPYADRLPIGLPEIIENAPASRLEGFYEKWYKPENMALIFVGDFDGAALEASLGSHFTIPASTEAFKRPRYNLPQPKKGNFEALVLADAELSQTRVDLYYKLKAMAPRTDLAGYRQDIVDYLASTMLYLRFEEARSKPETPYMAAGAGNVRYGDTSRYYALVGQAKAGAAEATLRELLTIKESLVRYGFTETEADIARRSLLSDMEQMVAEKDRQESNSYIRAFTNHFTTGEMAIDIEWEYDAIQKLLPGIALKEINASIKNTFTDDDLTVFISAPESEQGSLPAKEQIGAIVKEIRKAKIEKPQTAAVSGELLDRIPQAGHIVSEHTDSDTGALIWQLSNGMELILKETKNRNNEISLYAQARGGTYNVPPDQDISATLAAEMRNASGLGPYTQSELVKKLADKQVSFSFWASNFIRGFQGSAASGDISTLFEMIYLGFTQPRFDPDAVQVLLDNRRTRLIQEAEDPNAVFSKEVNRTVYGNPRFHSIELNDLDKVNLDDAMAFIEACCNPSDYTFVFTGNIDTAQFRDLAETYLASIPPGQPFNQWADADYQRPGKVEKEVLKGREERSVVGIAWFVPMPYSEEAYAASAVLNEYLDIVLNDEIRESLGGVYSISATVSVSPIPRGELSCGVYFICDPRRSAELSAAAVLQIQEIADGTINDDAFAKSIEALLKGQEESVQSNLYIAQSYANSAVIYNAPLSRMDRRPALYQAVKHRDIQDTAARLLEGGPARIILYPVGMN
ncbi:M16 family metallopeptidase [Leadbettera azotonutricia]|nr:M16 family metallopeptidase [Leadbettera azotonutricia]